MKLSRAFLLIGIMLLNAGCGGGSGSSTPTPSTPVPTTPVPTTPVPTTPVPTTPVPTTPVPTTPVPTTPVPTTPAPGLYPDYNTNPIAADATGMSSNAAQLAAKIKLGTNIGNTMEAWCPDNPSETCWANPAVSAAYIKSVKDSGFDAIRIPLAWDQYSNKTTGKISDVWLNRVKQVVQMAVDNGLYVIVNIHWDGGWLERHVDAESKVAVNAKQKAFWQQIATKLRAFDEHVMFASANEPSAITAGQATILASYHKTFVDAVRSTGGRNAYRVLVVQGLATDIDLTMSYWTGMPADTVPGRQMMEVHYYPGPFSNMDKDESWSQVFCYWGNGFKSATDTYRNSPGVRRPEEEPFTDAQFAKMKTKFVDKGIPVVLGEFAAIKRTSQICADMDLHLSSREYFYKYVTKAALANGILPFAWEVGMEPGLLFDRAAPNGKSDQRIIDAMVVGAGKAVGLNAAANSWTVSGGATNTSTTANMQLTLNQAGAAASYTFANPINWSGKTLKVVLNFDQAFISNRNGGTDTLFQFYTYTNGAAASELKCSTANKVLVAGQDTDFTCSDFSLQNAVGVDIQFAGTAGSVTIKRAIIK